MFLFDILFDMSYKNTRAICILDSSNHLSTHCSHPHFPSYHLLSQSDPSNKHHHRIQIVYLMANNMEEGFSQNDFQQLLNFAMVAPSMAL